MQSNLAFLTFGINIIKYKSLYMNSVQVRKTFLDFFRSKSHQIVTSAPMVVKNDPTLMFTNAGMNQFKDLFLGNAVINHPRVANTQKCLRVSGKHNDLDEVGHDTYHHTMFEMLGNWSFGDYFKKDAIAWAWELLTEVYKIDKKNLYVTVFGGDEIEKIPFDQEAYDYWSQFIDKDRIISGSKKDNFWEMGDTGPCGPCSEIHVDLRDDEDKLKLPGKDLVNTGDSLVIEIWNLVFIQYNRSSNGSLMELPSSHVDTGMGFERLCMVLQHKKSNYDTDIFQQIIGELSNITGKKYGINHQVDIAMRVIADHVRAVAFAIADGQLPSNNKAGYVIRRILRRAVRYGFTYLDCKEPFMYRLVPVLANMMGETFSEIVSQKDLIQKVMSEEEWAFLKTLSLGIVRFNQYIDSDPQRKIIDGIFAFELYDTFGFPIDLTELMAREKNLSVDMEGFLKGLEAQKQRSRQDAVTDTDDWVILKNNIEQRFVGYDLTECDANIVKYRKVTSKEITSYQIVLDQTPFYAESGGQIGDKGMLVFKNESVEVINTIKENDLFLHLTASLPAEPQQTLTAKIDEQKRLLTTNNHSATHLLHVALRQVLGTHVEQKGSMVDENRLRFDFAHFSKLSDEEIRKVEINVNNAIRKNYALTEYRNLEVEKAKAMGAMALFGEKYGDRVRVICFGENYSLELCGGTHVKSTGQIGFFKLISESAIAAGIRRIEAITATKSEEFIYEQIDTINVIKETFRNTTDIVKALNTLIEEKNKLEKALAELNKEKTLQIKDQLLASSQKVGDITFVNSLLDMDNTVVKDLAYALKASDDNVIAILWTIQNGKINITLALSDNLVNDKKWNASNIIREAAKMVNGGGGGQQNYATAGGSNPSGINNAIDSIKNYILNN